MCSGGLACVSCHSVMGETQPQPVLLAAIAAFRFFVRMRAPEKYRVGNPAQQVAGMPTSQRSASVSAVPRILLRREIQVQSHTRCTVVRKWLGGLKRTIQRANDSPLQILWACLACSGLFARRRKKNLLESLLYAFLFYQSVFFY